MKPSVICILVGLSLLALTAKAVEVNEELIFVEIPDDEQAVQGGGTAVLPCRLSICPQTNRTVKVTWKVGEDPSTATRIAECSTYDMAAGECKRFVVHHSDYDGRVEMDIPGSPDLTVRRINDMDNRNFWCQVQTGDDDEYGTDTRSVVVRVTNSPHELPKFNHVFIAEKLHEAKSGSPAELQCRCEGHCDDIAWYKGPSNEWGNAFEKIYKLETHFRTDPTITYGKNWEQRISVNGYSLTINKVEPTDGGRYWCEARRAGYYGVGEAGVDAKSMVLTVDRVGDYSCH